MAIDPLYLFVFAGLFSPGPNVIMLTSSGARFGFFRTLPHLFGVVLGVGIIAGVTGFGIGALLDERPGLQLILKFISAMWIFIMAVQLWKSTQNHVSSQSDKPFSFAMAVIFQWINPKIWAVAISASAGFNIGLEPFENAARLGLVFSGINLFVCLFWSISGSFLATILTSPTNRRIFMRIMSFALAASAIFVFV